MKILAIETSCDETAVALLECSGSLEAPEFKILGNALISQIEMHKEFGGVVPMLAKREHHKNLPILMGRVLKEAKTEPKDIDYIAVTVGPGLEPALWEGILYAEKLATEWKTPIIPVNHMEGHIYSPFFNTGEKISFPTLALLVSGGHTELVLIKNYEKYEILGKTRDDAVGEAFDKVARLLDLEYPGGPKISKLADIHRNKGLEPTFELPRPMIHSKDFDFSFSGLKTSVLYRLRGQILNDEIKEEMAHAFEDACVEVLINKTEKALEQYAVKTLIIAGGVSANKYLRGELQKLKEKYFDLKIFIPENSLTTDNAVMIGMAGYFKIKNGYKTNKKKLEAKGNLTF